MRSLRYLRQKSDGCYKLSKKEARTTSLGCLALFCVVMVGWLWIMPNYPLQGLATKQRPLAYGLVERAAER